MRKLHNLTLHKATASIVDKRNNENGNCMSGLINIVFPFRWLPGFVWQRKFIKHLKNDLCHHTSSFCSFRTALCCMLNLETINCLDKHRFCWFPRKYFWLSWPLIDRTFIKYLPYLPRCTWIAKITFIWCGRKGITQPQKLNDAKGIVAIWNNNYMTDWEISRSKWVQIGKTHRDRIYQ